MKKIFYTIIILSTGTAQAQYTGRVGINTDTPSARLDIHNKNSGHNILLLRNSGNTKTPITVNASGYTGINGITAPIAPLDILATIISGNTVGCGTNNFNAISSTNHKFYTGFNYTFGVSQCNHGNTLFSTSYGINGQCSTLTPSQDLMITNDNTADIASLGGGLYIAPHADATTTQPNAGLYIREDGLNGFSIPAGTTPKTAADINGSLMVGSNGYTDVTSATGSKCLRAGEFIYLKHFYVCANGTTGTLTWKQMDN